MNKCSSTPGLPQNVTGLVWKCIVWKIQIALMKIGQQEKRRPQRHLNINLCPWIRYEETMTATDTSDVDASFALWGARREIT